jgi:hypothetical protein
VKKRQVIAHRTLTDRKKYWTTLGKHLSLHCGISRRVRRYGSPSVAFRDVLRAVDPRVLCDFARVVKMNNSARAGAAATGLVSTRPEHGSSVAARKPDAVSARIAELLEGHLDSVLDTSPSEPDDEAPEAPSAEETAGNFRLFRDSPGGALFVPKSQLVQVVPPRLAGSARVGKRMKQSTIENGNRKDLTKGKAGQGDWNEGELKYRTEQMESDDGEDEDEGLSDSSSDESEDAKLEREKIASVVISWPGCSVDVPI